MQLKFCNEFVVRNETELEDLIEDLESEGFYYSVIKINKPDAWIVDKFKESDC